MDVTSLVPDNWVSRLIDTLAAIMLFMFKGVYSKFERQVEDVQKLQTEHEVLKANISNLTNGVSEVKDNTQEIMKILMQKK